MLLARGLVLDPYRPAGQAHRQRQAQARRRSLPAPCESGTSSGPRSLTSGAGWRCVVANGTLPCVTPATGYSPFMWAKTTQHRGHPTRTYSAGGRQWRISAHGSPAQHWELHDDRAQLQWTPGHHPLVLDALERGLAGVAAKSPTGFVERLVAEPVDESICLAQGTRSLRMPSEVASALLAEMRSLPDHATAADWQRLGTIAPDGAPRELASLTQRLSSPRAA